MSSNVDNWITAVKAKNAEEMKIPVENVYANGRSFVAKIGDQFYPYFYDWENNQVRMGRWIARGQNQFAVQYVSEPHRTLSNALKRIGIYD